MKADFEYESIYKKKFGIWFGKTRLIIASLLILVLLVCSGLIGHFATPKKNCQDFSTTENPESNSVTPPLLVSTTASPPQKEDLRLPTSLVPFHYNLRTQPHIYNAPNFTFNGTVEIYFTCASETNIIKINIDRLETTFLSLQQLNASNNSQEFPTLVSEKTTRYFLTYFLDRNLTKDVRYVLKVGFSGILRNDLRGFYRSEYSDGKTTRYTAVTHFEPIGARKAFPCFDEPALKATFNVTILRREGFISLSNTRKIETGKPSYEDWVEDSFKTSPRMSTYTLAFVVCDFLNRSMDTKTGSTVRMWAPAHQIESVRKLLESAVRIQEFQEEFTNMTQKDLGIDKMDHVAVKQFGPGAMENWGLIIYRDNILAIDPIESVDEQVLSSERVIAHELAHQYFGNLVTCAWWDHIFVNEAMATYFSFFTSASPNWTMEFEEETIISTQNFVYSLDDNKAAPPIMGNVTETSNIRRVFTRQVYTKGSLLMRMVEKMIGFNDMRKGLQNFLKKYSFKGAEIQDIFEELDKVAQPLVVNNTRINITETMMYWINNAGYPLLEVSKKQSASTYTVQQARHLDINERSGIDRNKELWPIPITYTFLNGSQSASDTRTKFLLKDRELESKFPNNNKEMLMLINVEKAGFYRVLYDENTTRQFAQKLREDTTSISVINRFQLLDDGFIHASNLDVKLSSVLDLANFLKNDLEYLPWTTSQQWRIFDNHIFRTSLKTKLEGYFVSLLSPVYQNLNWTRKNGELKKRLLSNIITEESCRRGHAPCISVAMTITEKFLSNKNSSLQSIKPERRFTALCTAIKYGDNDIWVRMREKMVSAPEYGSIIQQSLGCTRTLWALKTLIDEVTDSNTTWFADRQDVIGIMANSPVGHFVVFDFWKTNINNSKHSNFISFITFSILSFTLNTRKDLIEFDNSINNIQNQQKRDLLQTVRPKILTNIRWAEKNLQDLDQFFNNQKTF